MTGALTLSGSVALGVTGFLAALALLASDLPGQHRLASRRREAPGALERVEPTDTELLGQRIYRYTYIFTLPDGARRRGVSYAVGNPRFPDPQSLPGRREAPPVVVEYDPDRPSVNRLEGTHTGFLPIRFLPWALVPPPIALAVLWGGLRGGRRRIHLLSDGQAADAVLTGFTSTDGDNRPLSLDDIRRIRRAFPAEPSEAELKSVSDDDLTPELRLAKGLSETVGCLVAPMFGLGLVVIVGLMAMAAFNPRPFQINNRPVSRAAGVLFCLVFLAAWVGVWALFRRPIGRSFRLTCTFRYRPEGGEEVETQDEVWLTEQIGEGATEPVLYDPDDPRGALLLRGLDPRVRIGPGGVWEAAEPIHPLSRLVVAALSPLAGPLLAWTLWTLGG